MSALEYFVLVGAVLMVVGMVAVSVGEADRPQKDRVP